MFRGGLYISCGAFLVAGVVCSILGVYCRVVLSGVDPLLQGLLVFHVPLFLGLSGVLVVLGAGFTLRDLLRNDRFELVTLKVCLGLLVFVVICILVGCVLVTSETIDNTLLKSLNQTSYIYNETFTLHLHNQTLDPRLAWKENIFKSWNNMQNEFRCCGVNNVSDWITMNMSQTPASCCSGMVSPDCEWCLAPLQHFLLNLVLTFVVWALVTVIAVVGASCCAGNYATCSFTHDSY